LIRFFSWPLAAKTRQRHLKGMTDRLHCVSAELFVVQTIVQATKQVDTVMHSSTKDPGF
jgi:hypothetical protein